MITNHCAHNPANPECPCSDCINDRRKVKRVKGILREKVAIKLFNFCDNKPDATWHGSGNQFERELLKSFANHVLLEVQIQENNEAEREEQDRRSKTAATIDQNRRNPR